MNKIKEEIKLEIQKILEPYFITLDGEDNEPNNDNIIEISEKISQSLDTYAKEVIKECLPEKMTMRAANSSHSEAGFGWTKGFNDCREQMLINAGIKCKGCGQERCECGKTHNEPYSGFDAVE